MSRTLKEQAWQSGLVLFDENSEWNETDWPPFAGGWRDEHAAVVLDHTVVVLGGFHQGQGYVKCQLRSCIESSGNELGRQFSYNWQEGTLAKGEGWNSEDEVQ